MDDNYPTLNGRGYPDTIDTAVRLRPTSASATSRRSRPTRRSRPRRARGCCCASRTWPSPASTRSLDDPDARRRPEREAAARADAGKNLYYKTNSLTLGGGESFDVILDTTGVAPGTYLLYTTNLNYLSNDKQDFGGMMTEITIH